MSVGRRLMPLAMKKILDAVIIESQPITWTPAPVGCRNTVHQTDVTKSFTISEVLLQAITRILVLKTAFYNFLPVY